MGFEIERKFLVDTSKLPSLDKVKRKSFLQGYLSDKPTVRVRIIDGTSAELTIKGKGTVVKPEFNYMIPVEDAEQMKSMMKSVLEKTRYYIKYKGFTWEVDKFSGALDGLWLAEIELPAEDTAFKTPDWALREVTDDRAYSNARLAADGLPKATK